MHKKSSQKALSCHETSTPSKYWTVLSKELNMVEKQCILTEHKEGSGGLAAPADSLTLYCLPQGSVWHWGGIGCQAACN